MLRFRFALMSSLAAVSVVLTAGPLAYAHGGECKIAIKGTSPIAKACKQDGRHAASKLMKALVKKAKEGGVSFKCTACHENLDSLELKPNARDDLKKLIDAAAKP